MQNPEVKQANYMGVSVADYNELIKWAQIWQKDLALMIEETKEDYTYNRKNKIIILNKDNIPKTEAEEFLESLMDSETYAHDSDDLKYFGRLVEIWRPVAERPQ